MSKIGREVTKIQELAYMGIPNAEISRYTKTDIEIVDQVVRDMFESDSNNTLGENYQLLLEGEDER